MTSQITRQIRAALQDEIRASRSEPSRFTTLRNGRLLASTSSGFLYDFECDFALKLPTDTPVLVELDDDQVKGELISIHDLHITIVLREPIGHTVAWARLRAESWFILKRLEERLAEIETSCDWNSLSLTVLRLRQPDVSNPGLTPTFPSVPRPNAEQSDAVIRCATSSMHFVWGPPGTGKTDVIGRTAQLLSRKERVLLLAHSNVAVDTALDRVFRYLGQGEIDQPGTCLRYGFVGPNVRKELNPEHVLRLSQPDLVASKRRLENEKATLLAKLRKAPSKSIASELSSVRLELEQVQIRVREAIHRIVQEARVVGTTLSKFAIDDLIWSWQPDATLVDEASMAPLPFILAAASRTGRRTAFFGDPMQLPPVVLADTENVTLWLKRDIFAFHKVDSPNAVGKTFLRQQHRMAPSIRRLVSELSYNGQLTDAPTVLSRRREPLKPFSTSEVVLIDTSSLSACQRDPRRRGHSRFNTLHGALAVEVLRTFAQSADSVAYVTPYRAQANLVDGIVRDPLQ